MGHKIQIKRGHEINLPQLDNGEIALTSDTKDVYVGTPTGNQLVGGASITEQLAQSVQGNKPSHSVWEEFEQQRINVKWFGAKGNAKAYNPSDGLYYTEFDFKTLATDDTEAIQNALNYAANKGGTVYLPKGNYLTSKPLTLTWTNTPQSGLPQRPKITGIYGDGENSTILGLITESKRGILELIGTSNIYSVNCFVKDLYLKHRSNSNKSSYTFVVGDCKESFYAERLICRGANGMALKISSTNSYAQMSTKFSSCVFYANNNGSWNQTNNVDNTFVSVGSESGGASWDNVKFDSCTFNGAVLPRATLVEFDNCQFYTNPSRPHPYNHNVFVNIGNALFTNCYFEDHDTAIYAAPFLAPINTITVENCRFTGSSNTGYPSKWAVQVIGGGAGYNTENVTVKRSYFGDYSNGNPLYTDGSINITASKTTTIEDVSQLYPTESSRPLRINVPSGFSVNDTSIKQPKIIDKYYFTVNLADVGRTYYPSNFFINGLQRLIISRKSWISNIRFYSSTINAVGNFNLIFTKNGTTQGSISSSNFTKSTINDKEEGYLLNPYPSTVFEKDDKLGISVQTSADFSPVPTTLVIEISFAY